MQSYVFNYSQYKKKIHKKSKLSFVFLFLLIIVLLSTALFLWPKNLGYNEFYFVEIDSFLNYKEASSLALEVQEKGASGYIYFDGKYKVLASCYKTEEEAKSVVKNLTNEYKNATVLKLSTLKEITASELNNNEKNAVNSLKNSTFDAIFEILELILQFDKNEIQLEHFKLELKKQTKSVDESYNNFVGLTKNDAKKNVSKKYASNIHTSLLSLSSVLSKNNSSSKLKFELTNVIVNYCSFVESF